MFLIVLTWKEEAVSFPFAGQQYILMMNPDHYQEEEEVRFSLTNRCCVSNQLPYALVQILIYVSSSVYSPPELSIHEKSLNDSETSVDSMSSLH